MEHLRLVSSHGLNTAKIISVLSVRELEMVETCLLGLIDILEFVYTFPLLQSLSIVDSTWVYCSVHPRKYNIRPGQPSFFVRTLGLDRAELSSITNGFWALIPFLPCILYAELHTSMTPYEHDTPRNDVALLYSVDSSVYTLELTFRAYFRVGGVDSMWYVYSMST